MSTPFKMKGFSGFGNSPLKQEKKIDHVGRTVDKIHSTEKSIGELKESRAKDIKKVKSKTVKIKISDIVKQMKATGSKLKLSDVKKALSTSIRAVGKIAKFIPGVAGLVLSATKTATADQPTEKQGGGQMDPDWLKRSASGIVKGK